jgi:hypothetical protein
MSSVPSVPDELADDVQKGRCSVFVGAGLSVGAGYPTWDELLHTLIDLGEKKKLIDANKKTELNNMRKLPNKWLMIAQELMDAYEEGPFQTELSAVFDAISASPTDAHKAITEINFSFVVTTNYDQLIENAYFPKFGRIPKIFTHHDKEDFADALWKGDFFILKAHGSLDRKSTVILTEKDYRRLIYSSPGYRALLAAIFTTKTILFLGASLSDPELKLLLGSLHDSFQGKGQTHFALIPNDGFNQTEADHWRKNYNVRCLLYAPSSGHPELPAFLKELGRLSTPRP